MVIDIRRTQYAIHMHLKNGVDILTPYSLLAWEQLNGEVATRIRASIPDIKLGSDALYDLVGFGTPLTVTARWGDMTEYAEVARGLIEEISPNAGDGMFQVLAYDPIRALLASKVDAWYPSGHTPADLITAICGEWGVTIGTLDPLLESVTLGSQSIHGQSIADCITKWLTEAFTNGITGRVVMRSNQGVLECIQPGGNTVVYLFRQGESLLTPPKETFSIVDLITRVQVRGPSPAEGQAPLYGTVDGSIEMGVRQEIVYVDNKKTPAEIETAGRSLLQEKGLPRHDRSIDVYDVPGVARYDRIRVEAGTRSGYQIVESVSHQANAVTMTLTLGNVITERVTGVFTLADASPIDDPSTAAWDDISWNRPVTDGERYALAVQAGFAGEEAIIAVAVSIAENGAGDASALSSTNDIGLWQINEIWWAQFGGRSNLINGLVNAKAAFTIRNIQGWTAWVTFKIGAHLKFMDRARAAAAHPSAPPVVAAPTLQTDYKPAAPVIQTYRWSCSAASLAWALTSAGKPTSEAQAVAILGDRINSDVGLVHGDGTGLAAAIREQGFDSSAAPAGFDQVLTVAGTKPVMVGSSKWDHWTGVSGRQADTLLLANPSPNLGTTMTRARYAELAPFYMVVVNI